MQRRERQRARRSTVVGGASTTKGAMVWCKWRTQHSRTKVVGWGVGVRVYYYTVSDWWGVREGVGRGAGSTPSTVEAHP